MGYTIIPYEQIDRAEWGRLVRESETGTWFQSPEAYEFFATQKEIMEPFVVAISRQPSAVSPQTLSGVCVGYVTKEKNPIKQFFTRRVIILGGPALADDATNEEVVMLMNAVRQRLMIYDLGFRPCGGGGSRRVGHRYRHLCPEWQNESDCVRNAG